MSLASLTTLFEATERLHPDLMEPYSGRLAEALTAPERVEIMRAGLRATFRQRFPMPDGRCWPGSADTEPPPR